MRNGIIIVLIIFCFGQTLKSQYSVDRYKYDYHDYVNNPNDKYVPTVAGFASYIIPGLGHIYCNEPERGYKFMTAFGGAILVAVVGGVTSIYQHDLKHNNNPAGDIILITGCLSGLGIQIWSCIDAVRVSKINNLAFRDKKTTGYNIKLQPYLRSNSNVGFDTGLTLCFQIE